MPIHTHNPFTERRLTKADFVELMRLAEAKAAIYGGPLPWAAFNPGRHYVDLDMESMLEGDPIVQVRCKECDHFVLDCTCKDETLSDEELDALLADSSTPNLAALYAMAKEK